MKKLISPLLLIVTLFTNCEKEPECTTGTVRFTCTSANPYDVFIDGKYEFQIPGNSFTERDLPEGNRQLKAVQVSGYLVYPTIKEYTMSVFGCQEHEWIFP